MLKKKYDCFIDSEYDDYEEISPEDRKRLTGYLDNLMKGGYTVKDGKITVTVENYKKYIEAMWEEVMPIISTDSDTDIYSVTPVFLNEETALFSDADSGIYKKFSDVMGHITGPNEDWPVSCDEYTEKNFYWTVEKYRNIDEDYVRIFSVYIDVNVDYLFIKFDEEAEKFLHKDEYCACELAEIFTPKNNPLLISRIEFDFRPGDIVAGDLRPLCPSIPYYVYLGDGKFMASVWDDRNLELENPWNCNHLLPACFSPGLLRKVYTCPDERLRDLSLRLGEVSSDEALYESFIKKLTSLAGNHLVEFAAKTRELIKKPFTGEAVEIKRKMPTINISEGEKNKKTYNNLINRFMYYFTKETGPDEFFTMSAMTKQPVSHKAFPMILKSFKDVYEVVDLQPEILYEMIRADSCSKDEIWWNIKREKLFNNRYLSTMECTVDYHGKVLKVFIRDYYDEDPVSSACYMDLVENENYRALSPLVESYTEIRCDYEPGDILEVDSGPLGEKYECVYLGEMSTHINGEIKPYILRSDNVDGKDCYYIESIEKHIFGYDKFLGLVLNTKRKNESCNLRISKAHYVVKNIKDAAREILSLDAGRFDVGHDKIGTYLQNCIEKPV